MNNGQSDLLHAILSFDIDGGPCALTFEKRLARENGWSLFYAQRVVAEYKRFVYLAMVAGHPVTPSDEVDQAWHLHMTYCESYWDRLNGEVLPRPLKHNPTRGGGAEASKFDDWYRRTLESYERLLGEKPPEDIWPSPELRFRPVNHQRVNLADHWVLPKARVRSALTRAAGVAGVAVAVAAGCGAASSNVPPLWPLLAVAGLFGLIMAVVFWAVIAAGSGSGSTRKNSSAGPVDVSSGCGASCGSGCGSGCGGGGCGGGCGS